VAPVLICEVGPRDGLQNEDRVLSVTARVEFVNRLSDCGFSRIEVGSFVSARRVPQMADAERVFDQIVRRPGLIIIEDDSYSCLVENPPPPIAALLPTSPSTSPVCRTAFG